jgi:hypothetical protein
MKHELTLFQRIVALLAAATKINHAYLPLLPPISYQTYVSENFDLRVPPSKCSNLETKHCNLLYTFKNIESIYSG